MQRVMSRLAGDTYPRDKSVFCCPVSRSSQRVSVGREEWAESDRGIHRVLADQYLQKTGDLGWDLGVESAGVDRVSAVAMELVSRASGEAIWRFNGEWEIGSMEGVGEGCQVGKGVEVRGRIVGNLSRGIRGKREDFAGT